MTQTPDDYTTSGVPEEAQPESAQPQDATLSPGAYTAQGAYPPPPAGSYPPPPAPGWGTPPAGTYPNQQASPPLGAYPPSPAGAYPPSAGAYPPPPAGGYPPPPAGYYPPPPAGYYPPPPAAAGGYAPPPPGWGRPAFSIGEALSWAWAKFTKNALPLILATVVLFGIPLVIAMISQAIMGMIAPTNVTAYESDSGDLIEMTTRTLTGAGLAFTALSWIILTLVGAAIASAYFGGLLDIANGQKVGMANFFRPRNVMSVVIASVLLSLLTIALQILIGVAMALTPVLGFFLALLLIIPALAIGVLTLFATVAIVDRNLRPVDGIKEAWRLTKANFGHVALLGLTVFALLFAGLLACGVGVLVAMPVAYLMVTYAYRKFSGGTVAPAIV